MKRASNQHIAKIAYALRSLQQEESLGPRKPAASSRHILTYTFCYRVLENLLSILRALNRYFPGPRTKR